MPGASASQRLRHREQEDRARFRLQSKAQGPAAGCARASGNEATNRPVRLRGESKRVATATDPPPAKTGACAFEAVTSVIQTLRRTASLPIGAAFEQIFAPIPQSSP